VLDTNTYLVYDSESLDAVIVDVGGDPSEILDWVRRLSLRVHAVLATHGHFDHVLGVGAVRGALGVPFYMHRDDVRVAEETLGWYSRAFGESVGRLEVDYALPGDCTLRFGSLELRVIHTPGHTPGSVSIYVPDLQALFSGDTLFAGTVGRTDLPGGSERALAESIRKVFRVLPLDTYVYPGHGPSTTFRRELRANPFVEEALAGAGGAKDLEEP